MTNPADQHFRAVLHEVTALMRQAFAEVNNNPPEGSSLDQVFLLDGDQVVNDYVEHGEPGLAFDHLLYMVEEPPLRLSTSAFDHLSAAADALGVTRSRLDDVRPS